MVRRAERANCRSRCRTSQADASGRTALAGAHSRASRGVFGRLLLLVRPVVARGSRQTESVDELRLSKLLPPQVHVRERGAPPLSVPPLEPVRVRRRSIL